MKTLRSRFENHRLNSHQMEVFSRWVNWFTLDFEESCEEGQAYSDAGREAKAQKHWNGDIWTVLPNMDISGPFTPKLLVDISWTQVFSDLVWEGTRNNTRVSRVS